MNKLITAAMLLLLSTKTMGLEITASTIVTSEYSDNVSRSTSGGDPNIRIQPAINVVGQHTGPSLSTQFGYGFRRQFNNDDLTVDRNFFTGSGNLNWIVLPNRLEITANQSSTASTQNAGDTGAPNDIQVTSNVNTGPTLIFNPRANDQLRISYFWADRNTSLSNNDSTSLTGTISYNLALSDTSSLIASVSQADTEYDNDFTPDLESTNQTLTYNYANDYHTISITGGYSENSRDNADSVNGSIGNLNWRYRFAENSDFTLTGGRRVTDQASRLLRTFNGLIDDEFLLFVNSNITEVFVETSASIGLNFSLGTNQLSISAAYSESDFEDLLSDNEQISYLVDFSRRLNNAMSAGVSVRYTDNDESGLNLTDVPISGGINPISFEQFDLQTSVNWALASNFNVTGGVAYTKRISQFDELSVFVSATYNLFQRR